MTNETFKVDWDAIIREAPSVARRVAYEYPGIEASDIEQEIFLHCAENLASLQRTTKNVYGLRKVMHSAAVKYASSERLSYVYYSAQWVYTPKEIRVLFEAFFMPEYWEKVPQKDDGANINHKNVLCSLFDLDAAYSALSTEDQFTIASRYENGVKPDTTADKMRLSRAIDKVTNRLNGRMAAKTDSTTIDIYDSEDH